MKRGRMFAAVAGVLLSLAACGSDDDSTGDQGDSTSGTSEAAGETPDSTAVTTDASVTDTAVADHDAREADVLAATAATYCTLGDQVFGGPATFVGVPDEADIGYFAAGVTRSLRLATCNWADGSSISVLDYGSAELAQAAFYEMFVEPVRAGPPAVEVAGGQRHFYESNGAGQVGRLLVWVNVADTQPAYGDDAAISPVVETAMGLLADQQPIVEDPSVVGVKVELAECSNPVEAGVANAIGLITNYASRPRSFAIEVTVLPEDGSRETATAEVLDVPPKAPGTEPTAWFSSTFSAPVSLCDVIMVREI